MTQAQISYKMSGGSESPILSLPCSLEMSTDAAAEKVDPRGPLKHHADPVIHALSQVQIHTLLATSKMLPSCLSLPSTVTIDISAVTKGPRAASYTGSYYRRGVVCSLWFQFGAGAMFKLRFWRCHPFTQSDRLSGFAMATKTCRASELYQRPLNSMRSLFVLK